MRVQTGTNAEADGKRTDWSSSPLLAGGDVVTTESRLKEDAKGMPPAALGLNCVGGSSGTAVAK